LARGGTHRIDGFFVALVRLCGAHPWLAILATVAISAGMGAYAAANLTVNTDTYVLFPRDVPFLANEDRFDKLFPDQSDQILVVIDADSLAKAEAASDKLVAELEKHRDLFPSIQQPNGGPFFRHAGLLYDSPKELEDLSTALSQAQPMLGSLSSKPGLVGVLDVVGLIFQGADSGQLDFAQVRPFLDQVSSSLEHGLTGEEAKIDWASLFSGQAGFDRAPQSLVLVRPALDNSDLTRGAAATDTIRAAARDLGLTEANGYHIRLTGSVVLSDEELATVKAGAQRAGLVAMALVAILLVIALRSAILIGAALFTLVMGLVSTMGWAALAVGELNLISIAFAVMFIGIGIDFGIQFCMRLREERHRLHDPKSALEATALALVRPLLVAAVATSVGFFSFLPTDYRGVAELGVIAGGGIIIAFLYTLTLLPALVAVFPPRDEGKPIGYRSLEPFNTWLVRHRIALLAAAGVLTLVALAGTLRLNFDFDPLHLKDPTSEGMSTLAELMKDPLNTPYTIDTYADSPEQAKAKSGELSKLPEVAMTITALDLIPSDQTDKLATLENLSFLLGPALTCGASNAAPSEADIKSAVADADRSVQAYLNSAKAAEPLKGSATRLGAAIQKLNTADPAQLSRISGQIASGFDGICTLLSDALDARPVTIDDLPSDFKRSWITPEGQYRIEIYPKADMTKKDNLIAFVDAVRTVAPRASGAPISIYETSKLIIGAFATAAALALVAITILLAVALRRLSDMARVLLPLLLSIVWTMGFIGLVNLPLNFANVIGLPLLLGIGVTFPIYLVHAWRHGEAHLLAAPVARAVLFSALTTLASFGSLAISSHPGTASLGMLLSIALGLTLVSTFIFLPALLGAPPAKTPRASSSGS
jgi:hopanoid biosynthesis associated RND transporter like protein HpnN